jgi:hypothetical protein
MMEDSYCFQCHQYHFQGKLKLHFISLLSLVNKWYKLKDWSNLGWEADIFEGFILTPWTHDVGERTVDVLVEWCHVSWLPCKQNVESWQYEGQYSIHKDKELRICKMSFSSSWINVFLLVKNKNRILNINLVLLKYGSICCVKLTYMNTVAWQLSYCPCHKSNERQFVTVKCISSFRASGYLRLLIWGITARA